MDTKPIKTTKYNLEKFNEELINLSSIEMLEWGLRKFENFTNKWILKL